VEKLNDHRDLTPARQRNFVKVAPPTVHAGVGNALREAFQMDGDTRSLRGFEDLLGRMDRA